MENASHLLYLFLNFWLLRLELPLASYGNGIPSFFMFQPAWKVLGASFDLPGLRPLNRKNRSRETISMLCTASFEHNRSMVLFLRRYGRFGKKRYTESKRLLEALFACQATCPRPVFLVPLGILWGKRPEKMRKSILDVLLGGKETPGRLRQLLMLVRYSGHSVVTMGQVVDLQAYRMQNDHLEKDLQLKKIRWTLYQELALERRHITGPSLKPRKHVIESILSSRTLRELAREIARTEGKSFDQVMKRAAKYADEIAADYSITYIGVLDWVLTWVWENIYSGFSVDQEGLERVKDAVRKSSVILLPSHRSHLDYLVLSYIFYHNDLPPPHIAAGINLSFWPLGHIFRKAGAFYLRRTIRGQRLYAAVFSRYLRKLLREGYVQEFFLEGTRSRTGKTLQPKLGMLSMELDSFADSAAKDLQLIPISITYEKVVEQASYTRESGGAGKEKEGLLALMKTPRFLKKKYGKVYIQFAAPLSVREYLGTKRSELAGLSAGRRARIAEDLALRVCYAINEVAIVTPSALAATVLLNHPKRGIHQAELMKRATFLLHLLQDIGARKTLTLQNIPWAVEEVLGVFVGDKIIQRWDDPEGTIYTLDESKRIHLDYYKNNILHFFLPFCLAGNVFRLHGTDRLSEERFMEGLGLFMDLFSHEFLFPREDPVRSFWRRVRTLVAGKRRYLVLEDRNEIRVEESAQLQYMGRMLSNYLEAYFVFLDVADRILGSGECEEADFLNKVLQRADSLYRRGDIQRSESRSTFLFRNALGCFVSAGTIRKTRIKSSVMLCLERPGREKLRVYYRALNRLLFSEPSRVA
jgi:glycerol-3-phosphate O-acyltransferase